jgi:AcrR family transcriptional regulator
MANASLAARPRKGELTRQSILEHAARLSSRIGLEGLTIGRLADELDLSKSGLFAHFRSKESLQIQVLEFAADRFVQAVVRPALQSPRGEPRVRALFEKWLAWSRSGSLPGGCIFVAASTELDDRPGPVRDALIRSQREWMQALARCAALAVGEGHFQPDTDTRRFAHEFYGILLAHHHASRLLAEPSADEWARASFEALIARASSSPKTLRN